MAFLIEFVASAVLLPVPAAAPLVDRCPSVAEYAAWREAPDQQWDFHSDTLTVIGAIHSRDPAHEQFGRIRAAFRDARPGLVFFEGPDRGTATNAEEAIRTSGESGYVRFLATQAGIKTRSLEPSPSEQIKALLAQFPADQVLLFLVLREAARLREREGLSGAALDDKVTSLLQRAASLPGAASSPLPFADIAGLQAASERYWPGRDWRSADASWFSPSADDRVTGGVFAAAINRADSTNRNRHMAAQFAQAAAAGERPFVVVGRNHVPMIAPRLACLLEQR
ncbi:hypothetical protein E2493_06495 [Sphingomonas parva]|uniref:Uncharacterized protein n=1 Tax=Sphingomonas parva TaxID=2555898 RepID=A0A4Y8ZT21_9SPHN|nr:hypothetical protein [Sphingomonas parva]TFI59168.1 hypothetical protein E2493_06495 [Sphingomonas parva]